MPHEILDDNLVNFLEDDDAKISQQLKEVKIEIDEIHNKLLRADDLRLDLPDSFQNEVKIKQVFQDSDKGN